MTESELEEWSRNQQRIEWKPNNKAVISASDCAYDSIIYDLMKTRLSES